MKAVRSRLVLPKGGSSGKRWRPSRAIDYRGWTSGPSRLGTFPVTRSACQMAGTLSDSVVSSQWWCRIDGRPEDSDAWLRVPDRPLPNSRSRAS